MIRCNSYLTAFRFIAAVIPLLLEFLIIQTAFLFRVHFLGHIDNYMLHMKRTVYIEQKE